MDGYKSFGSYTPIYEGKMDELRELLHHGAAQAERVFRAYAKHAGPTGMCFPGLRRIANSCHYSETTTRRALTALFEHDYIRAHIEKSSVRRREELTFQISPFVMYIAADHIDEALHHWNRGLSHCNVIFNQQPESESESEPKIRTRISEPESEPAAAAEQMPLKTDLYYNAGQKQAKQPAGPENQSDRPQHPIKQPVGPENQPVGPKQRDSTENESVPPPPEVDLALCKRPFADHERESYAQAIKADGETSMAQARQLVASYGISAVRNALMFADQQRAAGAKIRSRFAFARAMLRKGAIAPVDVQPPAPKPLSGKYDDYFESTDSTEPADDLPWNSPALSGDQS